MRARLVGVEAITLDFGNTLVPVSRANLRLVVERTAADAASRLGPFSVESFLGVWGEERERQFREEVPAFREVDLADRFVRVLARLRGMEAPDPAGRWDDGAARRLSEPAEVEWGVEAYSRAFVELIPRPPAVGPLLERLAAGRVLAVLSNWPLAATIDRYLDAAGWATYFRAVVVSQRVGTIKPHPAIFAAAVAAIGSPRPDRVLHVGDDWAADVVGAKRAGWRVAYLTGGGDDSPLPSSDRDDTVRPDLEIAALEELEASLPSP